MGKTFHALQESSTADTYAEMCGLFLVFCVRSSHNDELKWRREYPFTQEQRHCLTRLEQLANRRDEPVTMDEWCPVIHRTFQSFVNCEEVKRMVAEVEWPLYRFLIAMSINSTGDGFGDPDQVPHVVKKLVYCIRANVFEQARQISEDESDSKDEDDGANKPTLSLDPPAERSPRKGS
jgi:hypothetical protein